jgi:hypothetical protein
MLRTIPEWDHTGIALPSLLPYVAATFAAPDQVDQVILVFALLALDLSGLAAVLE